MVHIIQGCFDMGVLPALFALTPVPGTPLEHAAQPSVNRYRRMQVARYLIVHEFARFENMCFDPNGRLSDFGVEKETLSRIIQGGEPYLTSGCPSCNRPYYNEKPSGPIYNYPKELSEKELSEVLMQVNSKKL